MAPQPHHGPIPPGGPAVGLQRLRHPLVERLALLVQTEDAHPLHRQAAPAGGAVRAEAGQVEVHRVVQEQEQGGIRRARAEAEGGGRGAEAATLRRAGTPPAA